MNAKLTHVPLAVCNQDRALEYSTTKVRFEKRTDYKGPTDTLAHLRRILVPGHERAISRGSSVRDVESGLARSTCGVRCSMTGVQRGVMERSGLGRLGQEDGEMA